jgi:serine acetyltransferase
LTSYKTVQKEWAQRKVGATVLGNILVGEGAQIAAGSLVLKPVVSHTMVAGSPAKQVGTVTGVFAGKVGMML